ncbi:alpha/beta fold hydrolase [Clostridium estertheticum]|uniref:alpha/beta fold hydrolase n=1 Tax=Clostridium estertheticum TaxID=238834 RepID=UPI001CF137FA|nr:alpha/beta hydrolase [Clostridium estertheticum]MCB2341162.1 alpha/beta hydrolase [Clostridium estertheticum]
MKKKKKNTIILAIVGLLIFGCLWEMIMQKKESEMLHEGSTYNINSHNMQAYINGDKNISVVFISGSGTPCAYTDFYFQQESLKKYAKTISFDHAGYGWSDDTHISRDVNTLADELDELLSKTLNSKKYVLVAHSLGALEAFRYAQKYSKKVSDVILLDGGNPKFYVEDSEMGSILINRAASVLRITGINRLLSISGYKFPLGGENIRYKSLPEEIKGIDAVMYYKTFGNYSNLANLKLINENAQTVVDNGYINGIRLHIISVDNGNAAWNESQENLLKWSDKSSQVIIKNGEHYVYWSNKEEVLEEIINVLNSVK